jgi:type III secretory pathway lipoprotein EscJ
MCSRIPIKNYEELMKILLKPANEPEANAIRSILKDNGIHAEIQSYHDRAYDGLFQMQYGWGVLRVPEKDFAEAEKIVQEWRRAAPDELPWDENPEG